LRPVFGVVLELALLAAAALAGLAVPRGPAFALYIVVLELASTYLVHCPAHYLVGSAAGIRFARIVPGRTALARVLPPGAARLAKYLPVLTLVTEKASLAKAGMRRVGWMYASGTVASVGAGLGVAAVAVSSEPLPYAAVALAVALAYLAFDAVFSPKGGDFARARKATGYAS